MDTMVLARELAALGRLGDENSTESVLRGLTNAVAAGVPGCSGGSAEHWQGERVLVASSHSELISLVEGERELGVGPSVEARRTGQPVSAPDLLSEPRWPEYAGLAVGWGVRSVLALPIRIDPVLLVVVLYAVRPGVLPRHDAPALARMLTEQVGVAMANLWDFEQVRTDAAQMQEALAGRAIIDQAKGIIMKSSGCSAEAAFEELRRISQHHQIKVADLAKLLVEEHGRDTP
ncbi:ANTAR domain-containing response regulator [Nonomuraea sp. NPDC050790]|uniref:ANTAR domain-containing response regulator n=1 Tax=Nonomuraea sp. NPDC050790 TaxID=3364371 RepID=UPI0037B3A56C